MAVDIVPALFDKIEKQFNSVVQNDKEILKFTGRIRDGTATMHDASLYARRLGEVLSDILTENIKEDVLPGGKLYYNIADRLITPMLRNNHQLANAAAGDVQSIIDKANKIGINSVSAEFPEERVNNIVNMVAEDGIDFQTVLTRMGEPIKNVSQSFFDDFVSANAEQRTKMGMKTQIVRKLAGGSCPWCIKLAGSYDYPEDTPADVFKRHDRCKCTVTYISEKEKTTVHSYHKYFERDGLTVKTYKELNKQLSRNPGGKGWVNG